ncbi:uncharacterized protein RJT21DRAFT_141706 [Scheffersomyces amazonensis]|uniref:uncharacterized protein n=1 Tax=Scheffersomyces amazonensis TaxID=1078765 RepID=UPI00315D4A8B
MIFSILYELFRIFIESYTTECIYSPTRATSLESLPDEVLLQIIDHLNQLDVLDLSLVNSRFHSLCMNKLYKRALYTDLPIILHRKMNSFLYTKFTVLNTLHEPQNAKFQEAIDCSHCPVKSWKENYVISCKRWQSMLSEEFNQTSIQKFRMLRICLPQGSYAYINDLKKEVNRLHSVEKLEICISDESSDDIKQLQGIFIGVHSLSLDVFTVNKFPLHEVLALFRNENIKELKLSNCTYLKRFLRTSIKSMQNLETLIINHPLLRIQKSTLKHLYNTPLQKFCLDIEPKESLNGLKYNIELVKALFKYCGSTLELVKINISPLFETTSFFSIDLFYPNGEDNCKGIKKSIKRLISWIKDNINRFTKLRYFTFYDYSFIIDRNVVPCQWIQISGKEL